MHVNPLSRKNIFFNFSRYSEFSTHTHTHMSHMAHLGPQGIDYSRATVLPGTCTFFYPAINRLAYTRILVYSYLVHACVYKVQKAHTHARVLITCVP